MPSLFFSVVHWFVGGSVGQAYSFVIFGLCAGLCGLQMCMTAKGWHYLCVAIDTILKISCPARKASKSCLNINAVSMFVFS